MATFGELIHGRKVHPPPFISTDPLEQLKKLLSGEIGAFPQITQLSDLYQKYMLGALDQALPGFTESMKTGAGGVQDVLSRAREFMTGELPADVMSSVFRKSAFQNLGSGLLGSAAGAANQARQLGQTSIDQILKGAGLLDAGTNAAQRWAQIASGTIMSPAQQLYSPDWFANFIAGQNQAKWNVKMMRENAAAEADPAWRDRAKMFASLLGGFAGNMNLGNSISGGPTAGAGGGISMGQGYNFGGLNQPMGTPDYKGVVQPNFGQAGNPGFFNNFWNSYNSVDPNNTGQGVGGMFGNWLGGIFNAGG